MSARKIESIEIEATLGDKTTGRTYVEIRLAGPEATGVGADLLKALGRESEMAASVARMRKMLTTPVPDYSGIHDAVGEEGDES